MKRIVNCLLLFLTLASLGTAAAAGTTVYCPEAKNYFTFDFASFTKAVSPATVSCVYHVNQTTCLCQASGQFQTQGDNWYEQAMSQTCYNTQQNCPLSYLGPAPVPAFKCNAQCT